MWIHDPDGNKFEIMQYTDKSLQHHGNIEEDQKNMVNNHIFLFNLFKI